MGNMVQLGDTGPQVGPQGFGCMGISDLYGVTEDHDEARATLEAAVDQGVTLFDTADMYGLGANEEFLAPFFAAHRDTVTVATKFGINRFDGGRTLRGDRAYVLRAAENSLRRLGVDVIDVYYSHRRDVTVPIEETVGAMAELVEAGKVRYLGLSEVTGPELRAAHAVHPITAVQSEWSLVSRDIETSVVPTAKELGVALVPYSPLGRGLLTGRFADGTGSFGPNDFRSHNERFTGDNLAANVALQEPVRRIADERGVSLATVALAWVHARATVWGMPVVPIPGTRHRDRLAENLAGLDLTLTESELAELEPLAEKVVGRRYPVGMASSMDRE